MDSETPTITVADEPEGATQRIAAAIAAPEKRKYTVSEAKLEQLKMAREKAAAAKAKKKPVKPVKASELPRTSVQEEVDLKSQIAAAVAEALKAHTPPEVKKAPRKAPQVVSTTGISPPPRPSREDLLMKIIRGY